MSDLVGLCAKNLRSGKMHKIQWADPPETGAIPVLLLEEVRGLLLRRRGGAEITL